MKLISDIIKMKYRCGIIWFRLPVANDSLCLDMKAIESLESGQIPKPSVKLNFIRNKDGFVEAFAAIHNQIKSDCFRVNLEWKTKMAEFDLFNGVKNISKDRSFMVLPTRLEIPFPECGRKIKVGRFYIKDEPIKIEIYQK